MKNVYIVSLIVLLLGVLIFIRSSSSMTPENSKYTDVQARSMNAECPSGYNPLGPTLCVKTA